VGGPGGGGCALVIGLNVTDFGAPSGRTLMVSLNLDDSLAFGAIVTGAYLITSAHRMRVSWQLVL
jgi:hypothetical protein